MTATESVRAKSPDHELELAKYLWEEYKYRHAGSAASRGDRGRYVVFPFGDCPGSNGRMNVRW
jgi:hypothetical protein